MKRALPFIALGLCTLSACEGRISDAPGANDASILAMDSALPDEDAGVIDEDAGEGMDAACRERAQPMLPAEWPFIRTKAGYVASFWSALPARATTCSLEACHDVASIRPPLIVQNDTSLDDPNVLATSMREIWNEVKADAGTMPNLLYVHRVDGGMAPNFTPEQSAYLQAFIAKGTNCALAPIARRERTTGPICDDAGICECPVPLALDLAGCDDGSDAGTPDTGI